MKCKYCKKRFKKKSGGQKYCSVRCRNDDYYLENHDKLLEYQKEKQKLYRKEKHCQFRERALKAWRTRREEEPKNNTYKSGMVRYNEPGNLTLSVYITHLNELGVDIRYGDFIGYQDSEDKIRYYTVSNDGKVTSDNKHKMFGYKPHYRTIVCVPAQETEFRGV